MSIICPTCSASNSDQARFCKSCRSHLRCPQCGNLLAAESRFCQRCGAPLKLIQASANRCGEVLAGRYRVHSLLGKGGMGAVYLVEDQRIAHRQWAVKEMIQPDNADPAEQRASLDAFKSEVQLLAQLDHVNLPKVIDAFPERNSQFLVMEYVPGKTLEKRLEEANGPLPEREVFAYAEQLCDALDYLHRQQPPVIFRDLKPANIMIKPDGKIKLIDFGIARHFKPGKSKDTQAMGTPGYAAPEQYGKEQSDARTDVYALGATLHHAVTGRDPGQDPFNFPPVRTLNRAVSPQTETAIMKAVQTDRTQRWGSVAALHTALKTNALPGSAMSVPAPTVTITPPVTPSAKPATPSTPPQSQPSFKRAGGGCFLLVTVGLGVWLSSLWSPIHYFGYSNGAAVITSILMLAYLLTHRPCSTVGVVLLFAVATLFPFSSFGGVSFSSHWPLLFQAGVIELLLMFTQWRTRNWFGLSLITFLSIYVPTFFGIYFWYSGYSLVETSIGVLIGVAVALLISNLVNRVTWVGR